MISPLPTFSRGLPPWFRLTLLAVLGASAAPALAEEPLLPRNVLVILADDQRADTLGDMPRLMQSLGEPGLRFTRAIVPTPLCSPSRAGLLSGGFDAANAGVLGNGHPSGGITDFPTAGTLPRRLQEAGWSTLHVGKYLNGTEKLGDYVPPGWTRFVSIPETVDWNDFEVVEGSSGAQATLGTRTHVRDYVTRYQFEKAVEMLDRQGDEPFFMLVSLLAPHHPSTPEAADLGTWRGYQHRSPSFNEVDLADKPSWVRRTPRISGALLADLDARVERRMECLASMDRLVRDLVEALDARGRLDDTLVVYTSDNGALWGEHRLMRKNLPYVEALAVPLVMRHPGLRLRGHSDALVAANLDLGATLADLAGIGLPTDGRSLVGPLFEGRDDFREQVPIQGWPSERPVWAGVLSGRWKYVVHGDGQEELYDLDEDPYELRSRHADPDLTAVKADLRLATEETRGPAIVTHRLPPALVGAPYAVDLEAWGRGSLSWSARGATLPEGLALSEHGRLEGAPTETGRFSLLVRVEEDSRSPWTGQPRSHVADLVLDVREPCGCASRGGLGALGLPLGGLLALLRRRIRGARGASGK